MDIERATLVDAERLADLWVDLAQDQRAHGSHLRPEPNREAVLNGLSRDIMTGDVLVARTADRTLVGFVQFGPDGGSNEQGVERGVVENLYVQADHRGDGLGSELLARAEQAMLDAGADRVGLEVLADNEAARRFYDRHGYEPHRVELEKSPESDNHTKED